MCFYFSRIWFCFRASSGFIAVFFVPLVCAFFSLSLFLFISLSFSPPFNVNSPELSSEQSALNESNHRWSIYHELNFFFLECVLILPLITTLDSVTLHTINPEKRCIHPPFSFLNSWYKYDFPHALFTL